ncbi:RidA family protein [Fundicoccus sp. Sow4_D5]|uniref:RidA family protein n=2 Tax=unclassified Fundicoccus TaxID=2761543 RepID=UPI003F92DD65
MKSTNAPEAAGPYSQAIATGQMVFLSGQLGSNQVTSAIEEVEVQTRQALKNINYLLSEAKLTLKNVIKVTVFLTDINNFAAVNTI